MFNVIAKYRSISTSLIFILFGFYFYISAHENSVNHNNNVLFGLTEMTWMWLIMGVSHFFIKNCDCKK